jgi:competence protein ComFC
MINLFHLHDREWFPEIGISGVFQYLFPPVCIFCGRILLADKDVSAAFFSKYMQICRSCLSILPLRNMAERRIACLSNPYDSDPIPDLTVLVPFYYDAPIVQSLRALKFYDAPYVAAALSFFMIHALQSEEGTFDAVVPIPLSPKRQKMRGYNQAELLAKPLSDKMKIPYMPSFLVRIRNTSQQSAFSDPMMRARNVSDAFAVPDSCDVEGLSVLLVDDVSTTGNTLHEAAWTLYQKGARHVAGIVTSSGRGMKRNP